MNDSKNRSDGSMRKFILYLFQTLTITLVSVSMFLPEYPDRFLAFVFVGNIYIVFLTSEITRKDVDDNLGKVLVGFLASSFITLVCLAWIIYQYKLAFALLCLLQSLLGR